MYSTLEQSWYWTLSILIVPLFFSRSIWNFHNARKRRDIAKWCLDEGEFDKAHYEYCIDCVRRFDGDKKISTYVNNDYAEKHGKPHWGTTYQNTRRKDIKLS